MGTSFKILLSGFLFFAALSGCSNPIENQRSAQWTEKQIDQILNS